MKLPTLQNLVKEDFPSNQQDMISKIAFILNPALTAITSVLTNGITVPDNFNGGTKTLTVAVDANGIPTSTLTFQTGLKAQINHIIPTRATNQTNSSTYPTACPFFNFSDNGGTVTVNQIAGLQAANTYTITILYMV
jgi:hypothetical protein